MLYQCLFLRLPWCFENSFGIGTLMEIIQALQSSSALCGFDDHKCIVIQPTALLQWKAMEA